MAYGVERKREKATMSICESAEAWIQIQLNSQGFPGTKSRVLHLGRE